jgi:hypothetical protein
MASEQRAALINYDMNAPTRFLDFGDLGLTDESRSGAQDRADLA